MQLTIHELERRTGLPRRTIHYYAHEGLLPSPSGAGPTATYGEEHLLRLQLITALKIAGLRLDRIGCALDSLCVEEMRRLVAALPGVELEDPYRLAEWLRSGPDRGDVRPVFAFKVHARRRTSAPRVGAGASATTPAPPAGCRGWLRREVAPGLEVHFCAETARAQPDFESRLSRLDGLLRELFDGFGERR